MRTYQPDVTSGADTLDSRDIIARIRELQDERDDLSATVDERQEALTAIESEESSEYADAEESLASAQDALQEWDADNGPELESLKALESEAEGYSDWRHGAQLINDSYLETYARNLAEELHSVSDSSWPFNCIDWEQAANELKQDYTAVDFDGVTYWIR